MTDLSNEVQKVLIQNEIAQHQQAAYILTLRHRVSKKIGASPEELKQIEEALLKTEKFIDAFLAELEQIK